MNNLHLFDKIIAPFVTEKSTNLSEQNKIIFKVPAGANKKNLKKTIERIFKVNVIKINIINKQRRLKLIRGKKVKVPIKSDYNFKKVKIWLNNKSKMALKLLNYTY